MPEKSYCSEKHASGLYAIYSEFTKPGITIFGKLHFRHVQTYTCTDTGVLFSPNHGPKYCMSFLFKFLFLSRDHRYFSHSPAPDKKKQKDGSHLCELVTFICDQNIMITSKLGLFHSNTRDKCGKSLNFLREHNTMCIDLVCTLRHSVTIWQCT